MGVIQSNKIKLVMHGKQFKCENTAMINKCLANFFD